MGAAQEAEPHHDERDVRLRSTRDHVLDEIAVPRGIDDRVVPLVREEPAIRPLRPDPVNLSCDET